MPESGSASVTVLPILDVLVQSGSRWMISAACASVNRTSSGLMLARISSTKSNFSSVVMWL
jgi:hypothetical protein